VHAFKVEETNEVLPPELSVDLADAQRHGCGLTAIDLRLVQRWSAHRKRGAQLVLTGVAEANAGEYQVKVSNDGGSIDSRPAVVEVLPVVQTGTLSKAWALSNNDRAYLADDNAQRGMAINPTNGNVLLVSRTGGTNLQVISGADGADLRKLNTSADLLTGGGIFVLNMIGGADDGAVYACNLSASGSDFTIYRWQADDSGTSDPEIVYGPGDPGVGGRIGDTLDVRGSGKETQILAASRSCIAVAIFTTEDGALYEPTVVDTDANANGNGVGSIDFGSGKVVALNTNNGVLAATLGKSAPESEPITLSNVRAVDVDGKPQVQFELAAPAGTYIIERSKELADWGEVDDVDVSDQPLSLSYLDEETEAYYRARPE
jgi:hypothetical protein